MTWASSGGLSGGGDRGEQVGVAADLELDGGDVEGGGVVQGADLEAAAAAAGLEELAFGDLELEGVDGTVAVAGDPHGGAALGDEAEVEAGADRGGEGVDLVAAHAEQGEGLGEGAPFKGRLLKEQAVEPGEDPGGIGGAGAGWGIGVGAERGASSAADHRCAWGAEGVEADVAA